MSKYRLQKISNYAKDNGISVVAVHKRINTGKLSIEEIDGVKFVKVFDADEKDKVGQSRV